jgi:hypothetical protein
VKSRAAKAFLEASEERRYSPAPDGDPGERIEDEKSVPPVFGFNSRVFNFASPGHGLR